MQERANGGDSGNVYCFGPLLIAPANELHGRVAVLYQGFVV